MAWMSAKNEEAKCRNRKSVNLEWHCFCNVESEKESEFRKCVKLKGKWKEIREKPSDMCSPAKETTAPVPLAKIQKMSF